MRSILKDCLSKRAALVLILPLLVGGVAFLVPHIASAQTTPAATTPPLAPVADYKDKNPAGNGVASCFNNGVFNSGSLSKCGTVITATELKLNSTIGGLKIVSGDVINCEPRGTAVLGNVCTVLHADGSADSSQNSGLIGLTYSHTDASGNTTANGSGDYVVQPTVQAAAAAVTSAVVGNGGGCGISSLSNIGQCIVNVVGPAMLLISTFFLGLAGVLFNLVVVKTVFQFSGLIGNAPGLLLAWGILRDIGNMALLFGFIFMGLMTILDLHSFPTKKAIPQLLIFAVLMNFSLFAAEAVIDTSNLFSTVLYAQANTAPCAFGGTVTATNTTSSSVSSTQTGDTNLAASEASIGNCLNVGIAGNIMAASGLSTIFSFTKNPGNISIAVYVGLSLFAIIGAIVMLAASIMLVIRGITLSFLMVLAPLGFAGMAIPPLHGIANRWWNTLLHQAFFAPILLLLIFISLKISETFATSGSNSGLAAALTDPNVSTMGIIMVFTLIIGFLIFSLKASADFGAMGASMAIGFAKTAVTRPIGAISGFAGRNTIGAGAARFQKYYESRAGHSKLLSSNFLGIDSGIAGGISALKNAKFGSGTSYEANQEHHKARHEEFEKAERKAQTQSALNAGIAALEATRSMPSGTQAEIDARNTAMQASNDKIAQIAQRMGTKEAEEILKAMKKESERDAFTQNLSPEKFGALVKDGSSLSEEQKAQARNSRFKPLAAHRDIINNPNSTPADVTAARSAIRQYSAKDLQNAPAELLSDNTILDALSGSQRDDLIKSNEVNPAITRQLRSRDPVEQVKATFTNNGGGNLAIGQAVSRLKPKQVAKLTDEILSDPFVSSRLTPTMLNEINASGDISDQTRQTIIFQLRNVRVPGSPLDAYLTGPGGLLWT